MSHKMDNGTICRFKEGHRGKCTLLPPPVKRYSQLLPPPVKRYSQSDHDATVREAAYSEMLTAIRILASPDWGAAVGAVSKDHPELVAALEQVKAHARLEEAKWWLMRKWYIASSIEAERLRLEEQDRVAELEAAAGRKS